MIRNMGYDIISARDHFWVELEQGEEKYIGRILEIDYHGQSNSARRSN